MKLFSKPVVVHNWDAYQTELLETASRRVAKMSVEDMVLWADGAASALMKSFEDYMTHHDKSSLDEITECVLSLQAVVKEISFQHQLTHEVD